MKKKLLLQERLTTFSLYAPSLFIYIGFFIIPAIMGFLYSFTSWNGITSEAEFIGISNYIELLQDKRFFTSILNTLIILGSQLIFFVFGTLVLADLIEKSTQRRMKKTLRFLYFFPYIFSYVVVAAIWSYILNYRDGIINIIFRQTGLKFLVLDWLGSPKLVKQTIALINVWTFSGFNLVLYMAAIQGIDQTVYESADIDGANWINKFIHITFPLVSPTFTVISVLALAWGLNTFEPVLILTNGGPGFASETISYYIYWAGFLGSRQGYGTAISLSLFIATFIISIIQVKLLRKREIEF